MILLCGAHFKYIVSFLKVGARPALLQVQVYIDMNFESGTIRQTGKHIQYMDSPTANDVSKCFLTNLDIELTRLLS